MVNKLIIRGGTPLHGEVAVSGAKNSATKLLIASLLTNEPVVLYNVPDIGDVDITMEICQQIGSQVELKNHELHIHTPTIKHTQVKQQTRKNRISVLALGPLLHRTHEAELPIVGGDQIGARPVNYHIAALRQMGVTIEEATGGYQAHAKTIHGTEIELPYPSVGATENIILTAVLAKGRTLIRNAATEPEIMDLVMMLQRMGAIIEFRAGRVIMVDGVKRLHGTAYTIMPDRLEAASYAAAALATNGKILVRQARQADLVTFLNTVRRMRADYHISSDGITFRRDGELRSIVVTTDVWPGFASDWQQPLAVTLTQAHGKSIIHETVYGNRFGYTKTLDHMGANITLFDARTKGLAKEFRDSHYDQSAAIAGPTPLHGTNIVIPDIRAGMAHVIAALTAQGTSTVTGVEHLLRGYDDPLSKLKAVDAEFKTE
ncbi:UDP-N-acetylglucosamine 1-carboxyvinyltransferase [Candidatus Microgenomates bacterium]|nr:UDP-N-acetylglucosamine 1-carboxyvinyltransferase [Candidatus Microgenomates bacterium]